MAKQLVLKSWGGKRKNAGRPNKTGRVSHKKRGFIKRSEPMHVTWRLKEGHKLNLRANTVAAIFKKSALGAKEYGLRILHYSILKNHLHLIVEADDNATLESGIKSFAIRFSLGVRALINIKGSLFNGRYHLHILKTPREVKNAIAYVLQNFAKHTKLLLHIDQFSSAAWFGGWSKLFGAARAGPILEGRDGARKLPEFLSPPRTWLGREGWQRA